MKGAAKGEDGAHPPSSPFIDRLRPMPVHDGLESDLWGREFVVRGRVRSCLGEQRCDERVPRDEQDERQSEHDPKRRVTNHREEHRADGQERESDECGEVCGNAAKPRRCQEAPPDVVIHTPTELVTEQK